MSVAKIKDALYCDECGSTDVSSTSIEEWSDMYEKNHGVKFLNNNY